MLTYAIGDIHGCHDKLRNLLAHCASHRGKQDFRIVFLGDYVDRGSQSREVVDLVIETQLQAPDRIVALKGNHEDMLLAAAQGGDAEAWLYNGGDATLASYGVGRASE